MCLCASAICLGVCECNFYEFVYCLREEFVSVWVAICVCFTVCGRNLCARGCSQFCGCEREHFKCVRVCFVGEQFLCMCVFASAFCLCVGVCVCVCVCERPSDNFSTSKLNSKTFLVDGMKQGGRCRSI